MDTTEPAAVISPAKPPAGGRTDFRQGLLASLTLWPGVFPFGIAYALSALAAGLDPLAAQAMSLLVYAGGAQLSATGLFAAGANAFSIVLTTLVINSRNLLLTVAISPYLKNFGKFKRWLLAFGLSEESYALSIDKISAGQSTPYRTMGVNAGLYICWQLSTFLGLALGGRLPDLAALNLQLVFPLSFFVLLIPYLKNRPGLAAALAGGTLALLAKIWLGGSWYLLIGGLGGSLSAMLVERQENL